LDIETSPIVDWATFSRARTELGSGFVRILGYFREDGEKSVARIEEAMQRRDVVGLVTPAQRLSSDARQFGAEMLAELSEEIEEAARRSLEHRFFPDEIVPQVAKLRSLYLETMELFQKETNPLVERRPAFGRVDAHNQEFGRL
jgi:HPt (histidine-containing phosphotransfer) domain-containing protein